LTFWHGARSRPRAIFFVNNFTIDKQAKPLYIINMMNDDFRDMMPTSEEFYAMMAKKDADFENAFKCDDEDDE
jgi:hypothetical protein